MSEPQMAASLVLALLNLIALGLLARTRFARKRERAKEARQPRKAAGVTPRREKVPDTSGDQLLALVEEIERAERSRPRPSRGESQLAEDLERWHAVAGDDPLLPQAADSCRPTAPDSAKERVA